MKALGDALSNIAKKITRASYIDKKFVKGIVKDIQRALLISDVNVKLVMELSKKIEERALKEKPKPGLSKKEHVLSIVYEELVNILGEKKEFKIPKRIMLVGLQGSGKTTTCVKLAKFYRKKGAKPFIITVDTYRPAAYEQILQLAEPLQIKVYGEPENKNPFEILKHGLEKAKKSDVIILDTAGRHRSEKELFEEMKNLCKIFQPDEKFLIIDSTIGQQAGEQAKAFHEAIGITGVILTKLDGSAKGGGALSAVAATGAKIIFIGTGEKIDDFEIFDPSRFISRLLGMGDLATLMEKAKESIDEKRAKDILKGEFTIEDLKYQIEAITKMGPLSSVLKMIPGFGFALDQEATELTEEKMKKFLVIMDSMTREERLKPKIINSSRIRRIARGSGTSIEEVRELMNYYTMMKKALKAFKRGRFKRMPFKIPF